MRSCLTNSPGCYGQVEESLPTYIRGRLQMPLQFAIIIKAHIMYYHYIKRPLFATMQWLIYTMIDNGIVGRITQRIFECAQPFATEFILY